MIDSERLVAFADIAKYSCTQIERVFATMLLRDRFYTSTKLCCLLFVLHVTFLSVPFVCSTVVRDALNAKRSIGRYLAKSNDGFSYTPDVFTGDRSCQTIDIYAGFQTYLRNLPDIWRRSTKVLSYYSRVVHYWPALVCQYILCDIM